MTAYNNKLQTLGQELVYYQHFEMESAEDTSKLSKKGYLRLISELDQVRAKILDLAPLLSLREVYACVHNEESRRAIMLGPPLPFKKTRFLDHVIVGQGRTKIKTGV